MNLIAILKYLIKHPLNKRHKFRAVLRFITWQVYSKTFPYPIIFPFTGKTSLIMKRGASGATNNLYCGLHEYEDMAFILHYLRAEDTFIDIGANIGSFTILAAGHVGAKTICFEPIPDTYKLLKKNIAINSADSRVTAMNIGLGAKKGKLQFTKSLGGMNHVARANDKETIEVDVDTLDNVLATEGISAPKALKIDVEGFETEVFNGAEGTLKNPELRAIIIEFGLGVQFGYDEDLLRDKFRKHGFQYCRYDPKTRELFTNEIGRDNFLFIRDIEFVRERLKSAEKITLNKEEF